MLITFHGVYSTEIRGPLIHFECPPPRNFAEEPQGYLYRPLKGQELDYHFSTAPRCEVWLRYELDVDSLEGFFLQFGYATLDWAQPWLDGVPLEAQGSALPIRNRVLNFHLPTWIIHMGPGHHHLAIACSDTTGQFRTPHVFLPERKFLSIQENRNFLDGITIGILLFHVATAFILAFALERRYSGRLYAAFIFVATLYLMTTTGHAYYYLWPKYPKINSFIQLQTAMVAINLLVIWILRFQNAQKILPRLTKAIQALAWSNLGIAALLPLCLIPSFSGAIQWLREHGTMDLLSLFLETISLLIIIWLAFWKRNHESQILFFSLLAPIFATMLAFAHDLGLLQMSFEFRLRCMQWASMLMFVALSGMLIFRIQRRFVETTDLEHRFSTRVVLAGERERRQIAREIHDDIGQRMVALQYQLYNSHVPEAAAGVRDIIKDLRHMAHSLHPVSLINGGLHDALTSLAHDLETKSGFRYQIHLHPLLAEMTGESALHLLRIIQESTSNAQRHGNASSMTITSQLLDGKHVVQITNDGQPMNPKYAEGFGLTNIRARMRLLGGSLTVENPDEGGPPVLILIFPA
ncbi:MAG TPA: 7TM diverse intracellular signaling domain-containing protein [Fibrobacteraceae bacterium]|nr:7TM diverse intracellular signaling domain-containing protein [Fibrobacteraceae bacterium]